MARAQAERSNHAKSEFLSRIGHELRTPLNAVIGFAQLLEMDELPSDQRESVHHIHKAGRHLLELINEVLQISRIEAGNMALSLEPIQLDSAVADATALIQPLAAEHEVDVEVRLAKVSCVYVPARQPAPQTGAPQPPFQRHQVQPARRPPDRNRRHARARPRTARSPTQATACPPSS